MSYSCISVYTYRFMGGEIIWSSFCKQLITLPQPESSLVCVAEDRGRDGKGRSTVLS